MATKLNIETITAFAKRRGFIYPSSEIYGGLGGVYDYGHYGTLLKNNIRDAWWKAMVLDRDDMVGLDSAIFMHQKTWEASGHVAGFSDPQIDCRTCKNRMRADHLLEKLGVEVEGFPIEEINAEMDKLREQGKLKCDKCGSTDLTAARNFNLLVKTNFASPVGELNELSPEDIVYPRGETCQGIYLNYKNVVDTMRVKLPFGIAQIGKAFRNEIVARQYIFRTREFEQMEMQYFHAPEDTETLFEKWRETRWQWYLDVLKLPAEKIRWKKHDKLVFYATAAYDIQYDFSFLGGFAEVEGIHARSDYDLSQHSKYSGKQLDWFDQKNNKRFIPHIMETSGGLNRMVLAVLDNAYNEESLEGGKSRVVLILPFNLAPIKVAVFPLQRDEKLRGLAEEVYHNLKKEMVAEFDDSGNIGKMYRRQDEIGTPYCVTVDYQSLEDGTVTLRERDSMQQQRVKLEQLSELIKANS